MYIKHVFKNKWGFHFRSFLNISYLDQYSCIFIIFLVLHNSYIYALFKSNLLMAGRIYVTNIL